MRWVTNLKRLAKECKDGTYNFLSEFDEKMNYEYYDDQYLMNEEEFTIKQSEIIEKSLRILRDAIKSKYPDIELHTSIK